MTLLADQIIDFYKGLQAPANLPASVEVLNPYQDESSLLLTRQFYKKYFSDTEPRRVLFGINPGRFGGGVTGIPFTDPIVLEEACGIPNDLHKRQELSSRFIYEMIQACGGPDRFYKRYFISAVSPLGFVKEGKNLNYYDINNWKNLFSAYVVKTIKSQMALGLDSAVAYSIGQGTNLKYLNELNNKHHFFDKILPLPHPRWVMQYRLKRKNEFIEEYHKTLFLD